MDILWEEIPYAELYPNSLFPPHITLDEEEDIITIELSQSSHLTEDEFTVKIIPFAPAVCLPSEYVYHVLDGNQDVPKMETAARPEEPEAGSPNSEKSWGILGNG